MIFQSTEIRWFSDDKDLLWNLYHNSFPAGEAKLEKERTDHYLFIPSENTGIKIREGKHELKLRSNFYDSPWGKLESWTKWSYPEEQDILQKIPKKELADWIPVRKKRWIKKYNVLSESLVPIGNERVLQGCGLEFTEITINGIPKKTYTLGFEAFSVNGNSREVLEFTLRKIEFPNQLPKEMEEKSYPAYLMALLNQNKVKNKTPI